MLSVLVELLEEKGVLEYEEREKKIKEKIKESSKKRIQSKQVSKFFDILTYMRVNLIVQAFMLSC